MEPLKLSPLESSCYYSAASVHDRPVLGIIMGEDASLMIDAGNSAHHVQEFLMAVNHLPRPIPPIKYVVLTHWHWDHVFGLHYLHELNLISIAHAQTYQYMEKMKQWEWTNDAIEKRIQNKEEIVFVRDHLIEEFPENDRQISIALPLISIISPISINLGKNICHICPVGGDHSSDSLIIYDSNVCFLGDCMYPNLHSKEEYTEGKLTPMLAIMDTLKMPWILEGHGNLMDGKTFHEFCQVLRLIEKLVRQQTRPTTIIQTIHSQFSPESLQTMDLILKSEIRYYISAFTRGMAKSDNIEIQ